jgi:hypothetical protein
MTDAVTQGELKKEMLKYAPELENAYKAFVLRTFESMKSELGPTLKGVYSSRRWSNSFAVIRSSLSHGEADFKAMSPSEYDKVPFIINEKALDKESKRYGEETALLWYNKMIDKLGPLEKVTVSPPNGSGFVDITGHYESNTVVIHQQPILKTSPLGKPFHQFPALIYVNSKFMSENEYKKTIRGWGARIVEKPKTTTQYKCGHCGFTSTMSAFKGKYVTLHCPQCESSAVSKEQFVDGKPKKPAIDPESRPKDYHFRFKIEYIGTPELPHNYGRIETRSDSAKGMTEEEAWAKIYKREMRDGYYARIFDVELERVYTWNGQRYWAPEPGNPAKKISYSVAQASSKTKHKSGAAGLGRTR